MCHQQSNQKSASYRKKIVFEIHEIINKHTSVYTVLSSLKLDEKLKLFKMSNVELLTSLPKRAY